MTNPSAPAPSAIVPEKSLLYVAPGVVIEGKVSLSSNPQARAVICGTLRGEVDWDGTIQVAPGGSIEASGAILCRELVVAGSITGSVRIETGLLRLEHTAQVSVDEASLPPGGLEQLRGATFNGKIVMGHDHRYSPEPSEAGQQEVRAATPAITATDASSTAPEDVFPIAERFGSYPGSYTTNQD